MTIANDTAEGLFDGFDWEMTNLHNISAYEAGHLLVRQARECVNPHETQPPPQFIADMQGEPTTREAPSGANSKKPPAGAASKMAKKAWMAQVKIIRALDAVFPL